MYKSIVNVVPATMHFSYQVISKRETRETSWKGSKKRKQRRTNENTSMSEEAKAGLANEALAICSNGQKDRVKRGGRFCKILAT